MGLDMFLNGGSSIYGKRENDPELLDLKLAGAQAKRITYEIGYWRKANAIHKWFIDNLSGDEGCQGMVVTRGDLIELSKVCLEVKEILDANEMSNTTERRLGWARMIPVSRDKTNFPDNARYVEREDGNGYYVYADAPCYSEEVQDKCCAILPPCEGFFFGTTDIGGYYYETICDTLKIIERALDFDEEGDDVYFEYQASW